MAVLPIYAQKFNDDVEKKTQTSDNDQLPNTPDETNIYKRRMSPQLDIQYLFPGFYKDGTNRLIKSFCSHRGCIKNIKTKRNYTDNINIDEMNKGKFYKKIDQLQGTGGNTVEKNAMQVGK